MAGVFFIATDYGKEEKEGNIIKVGKGKKAQPAIGISKGIYQLTHIPSGLRITQGYEYLSQAKTIANEIIEYLGDKVLETSITPDVFSEEFQIYLYQRWLGMKVPPTFKEWLNGPDYEQLINDTRLNQNIPIGPSTEYDFQLQAWDRTVAWIPSEAGELQGSELRCIIEGKPFSS